MNYILTTLLCIILCACSQTNVSHDDEFITKNRKHYHGFGKILGDKSLTLNQKISKLSPTTQSMATNNVLWKAALDVISFMPLKHTDPISGIILTEWYINPDNKNEKLKIDIKINSNNVRVDGLKVSVFTQKYVNGKWSFASQASNLSEIIEDKIINKAKELNLEAQ